MSRREKVKSAPTLESLIDERGFLRDLVVACNRMVDRWAEGDDAVKQKLWQDMTSALRDYCTEYGWPAEWHETTPNPKEVMGLLEKLAGPRLSREIRERLS